MKAIGPMAAKAKPLESLRLSIQSVIIIIISSFYLLHLLLSSFGTRRIMHQLFYFFFIYMLLKIPDSLALSALKSVSPILKSQIRSIPKFPNFSEHSRHILFHKLELLHIIIKFHNCSSVFNHYENFPFLYLSTSKTTPSISESRRPSSFPYSATLRKLNRATFFNYTYHIYKCGSFSPQSRFFSFVNTSKHRILTSTNKQSFFIMLPYPLTKLTFYSLDLFQIWIYIHSLKLANFIRSRLLAVEQLFCTCKHSHITDKIASTVAQQTQTYTFQHLIRHCNFVMMNFFIRNAYFRTKSLFWWNIAHIRPSLHRISARHFFASSFLYTLSNLIHTSVQQCLDHPARHPSFEAPSVTLIDNVPPYLLAEDMLTILAQKSDNQARLAEVRQAFVLPQVMHANQPTGYRLVIIWMVYGELDLTPMTVKWGPGITIHGALLLGYFDLLQFKDMYHPDKMPSPVSSSPVQMFFSTPPGREGRGGRGGQGRRVTFSLPTTMDTTAGASSLPSTLAPPQDWSSVIKKSSMTAEDFVKDFVAQHVADALTTVNQRLDQQVDTLATVTSRLDELAEEKKNAELDRAIAAFDRQASVFSLRVSVWHTRKATCHTQADMEDIARERDSLAALRQRLLQMPGANPSLLMDFP